MDRVISRFQVVDPNTGTVFDVVELQKTEVRRDESGKSQQVKTETRLELAAASGFPLSRIDSDTFRIAHANLLVRKIPS